MLKETISQLLEIYSKEEIIAELCDEETGSILSVIADGGMHRTPTEHLAGRQYVFSSGMIDTTSSDTVACHMRQCCVDLAKVLREDNWSEVRLFFSGHALLGAYAKQTIYRITHLDSVDYGFFGDAGFRKIELSLRRDLLVE